MDFHGDEMVSTWWFISIKWSMGGNQWDWKGISWDFRRVNDDSCGYGKVLDDCNNRIVELFWADIYIYIYIIIYHGIYNGIFVIPTHAFFHPIRIVKDKYFHENPHFSDRNVHVGLFICSRFYRTICGISPCYKLGGRWRTGGCGVHFLNLVNCVLTSTDLK